MQGVPFRSGALGWGVRLQACSPRFASPNETGLCPLPACAQWARATPCKSERLGSAWGIRSPTLHPSLWRTVIAHVNVPDSRGRCEVPREPPATSAWPAWGLHSRGRGAGWRTLTSGCAKIRSTGRECGVRVSGPRRAQNRFSPPATSARVSNTDVGSTRYWAMLAGQAGKSFTQQPSADHSLPALCQAVNTMAWALPSWVFM